MLRWQDWDVEYWPGGWVRATDKTGVTVVLHYKPQGEGDNLQLRLHTTLMTSVEPITARRWRDVPLTEIEDFFKLWMRTELPMHGAFQHFLASPPSGPPTIDEALSWFEANESQRLKIGANIPTSQLIDDEIDPHTPWETVKRPEGGRLSDEFLENLANVYRYLVARGEDAPAKLIGDGAGVPVTTVHRWIARARQRGFLPPAIRGRAG